MGKGLFFLTFLFLFSSAMAQTGDIALDKAQRAMALEEIVKADPQNDAAWIEWYFTTRKNIAKANTKNGLFEDALELDEIAEEVNLLHPNSAASGVIQFTNSNYTDTEGLIQAAALQPQQVQINEQLVNLYTIQENESSRKKALLNLENAGTINAAELEYAKNVLKSVGQNGVVLMNAEEDAHPLFFCQDQMNMRKDVKVIFIDLLQNDAYASQVGQLLGKNENYLKGMERERQIEKILSSKYPELYLGLTLDRDVLKDYASRSYLTGLTMRYSNEKINNLPILGQNYDQFSVKHLFDDDAVNRNYLLPLISLYKFRKQNGLEHVYLKQKILQIADVHGLRFNVEGHLD